MALFNSDNVDLDKDQWWLNEFRLTLYKDDLRDPRVIERLREMAQRMNRDLRKIAIWQIERDNAYRCEIFKPENVYQSVSDIPMNGQMLERGLLGLSLLADTGTRLWAKDYDRIADFFEIRFDWEVGDNSVTMTMIYDRALKITSRRDAEKYIKAYARWISDSSDFLVPTERALEIARVNIGYWGGYYGSDSRRHIYEVFGIVHPVFGMNFDPTAEESLQMGERWATLKK